MMPVLLKKLGNDDRNCQDDCDLEQAPLYGQE